MANSRRTLVLAAVAAIVVVCHLIAAPTGQTPSVDSQGHHWWQHAVFYEIYPRSFADSNRDGIGDVNGITSRLDYLSWLGVDAVWLTPLFPSPQVDFGYDVSNYRNVDPQYGTLADVDRLIGEARKKNIRVILDLVMNHTSDQHPWFQESASSRINPKRDWYIWRDSKAQGKPPNNWTATFGGSAWKFDSRTGQWYYHYFYPQQPDLNWRNPAVEKAMFDVTRWWYQRGVAGFRLDAVDTLFEDPKLRDNPVIGKERNAFGDPVQETIYNTKLPEVHGVLERLRQLADESDAVLIGETWTKNIDELKAYYGAHGNELHMPMDLMFATVNKLSASVFRAEIAAVDAAGGWPVFVLGNHDMPRIVDRYGDGKHNDQIAKLMAALLLTLRGTPILYYGDELGMENNDPRRREDVQDPIGKLGWPREKGRDGERTPMQWDASANAGFSPARPWNPVGPRYPKYNVAVQQRDTDSILNFYRQLLALRRSNPALLEGRYVALNESDQDVLAYQRTYKRGSVLVLLNMSPSKQTFHLQGVRVETNTILSSGAHPLAHAPGDFIMEPFGVYIGHIPSAR